MNPIDSLKTQILSGAVRHAVGWIGAALVARGYIGGVDPAMVDQIAGAIMMGASLVWSARDKIVKADAVKKVDVPAEPETPFDTPEAEPAAEFSKGFFLSERSKANLDDVHPSLVRVITAAIVASPEDFTVIEGKRTRERQLELYNAVPRRTWTLNSLHLEQPDGFGHAVDLAIIENGKVVDDLSRYEAINAHIQQIAFKLGVGGIEWGGDWKQRDGLHWQIKTGAGNAK
ncbi:MAG: M15 family metallopeptidase [Thiothrix sp.]|uniref:M15 family metallopeptidase n=1 Tax=Thiothrix sp. TaxID=1032 RepID=UPI00261A172F|nr:M15 family metallopeptidase [Thiothrix sp.]MDD5395215.1 M15 family metallopeptidase [Thiothrix sp.]